MKWLKKWAYLMVFAGVGFAYLTCVDEWQVYAKPMSRINQWIEEQTGEKVSDNQDQNTGDVADSNTGITDGAVVGETTGGAEDDNAGDAVAGNVGELAEGVGQGSAGNAEGVGQGSAGNAEGVGQGSAGNAEGVGQGSAGETIGEIPQGTAQDSPGETTEGIVQGTMDEVVDSTPTYMTVEDNYFADAVFIGDSRTVGMFEYGGLEEIATFYASTGLSVYDIFKEEFIKLPNRKKKASVIEALEENTFAKVYLMLGINEMGTGTAETFAEKYAEVVARIQELQPDAIIYIQGIMKVSAKRSEQGDYIHNEGIIARNEAIAALADNEKIFYLDVNPLICDETGGMVADYTWDGVHLKAKYIEIWKQFLKEHAILKME